MALGEKGNWNEVVGTGVGMGYGRSGGVESAGRDGGLVGMVWPEVRKGCGRGGIGAQEGIFGETYNQKAVLLIKCPCYSYHFFTILLVNSLRRPWSSH